MSEYDEPSAGTLARVRELAGQAAEHLTPRIEGAEQLPSQGAAIVAFNHVSPLEWLRAPLAGRRVHFLGQEASSNRGWLSRRGGEVDPLAEARRVLDRGELLGMFPEGPMSPDGRLYRGRTQLARLALATGAAVHPAAVLTEQHPVTRAIAPRIVVGPASDLERFRGQADDDLAIRMVTDQVMYELMLLSGQTYMDVGSGERRDQLGQQRRDDSASRRAARRSARAAERARVEQRRADRAAEAAELARAHAVAAEAAREQARRAAEQDATRRAVRATRLPAQSPHPSRDLRAPRTHRPDVDDGSSRG